MARERIDFFFRQLSTVKKKEEASRQSAREAERKAEGLERQLDEMRSRLKEEVEERTREEVKRLEEEREAARQWQQKNYSPTGSGGQVRAGGRTSSPQRKWKSWRRVLQCCNFTTPVDSLHDAAARPYANASTPSSATFWLCPSQRFPNFSSPRELL